MSVTVRRSYYFPSQNGGSGVAHHEDPERIGPSVLRLDSRSAILIPDLCRKAPGGHKPDDHPEMYVTSRGVFGFIEIQGAAARLKIVESFQATDPLPNPDRTNNATKQTK